MIIKEFRNRSRILLSRASSSCPTLDIAERRTPEHGRFLVKSSGRRIELRVSTLPTQYGEGEAVIRLLGARHWPVQDFHKSLDFPASISETLQQRCWDFPKGTIWSPGWTRLQGKTTTLYSSLNLYSKSSIDITVENPVENTSCSPQSGSGEHGSGSHIPSTVCDGLCGRIPTSL